MGNDLISRSDLLNVKPEFLNEKVVRDTKYQTTKDRVYAKAWNACNSCWLNTVKNAPTVETDIEVVAKDAYEQGYTDGWKERFGEPNEQPQGEWITYDVDITPHPLHCKNCGWGNHHIKNEYIKEFKVCPDCGARMQSDLDGFGVAGY